MAIIKDRKDSILFELGEENVEFAQFFTGKSYLKMLSSAPNAIANVTFEPGCRNFWHSHEGGQILFVTKGEGYYQEWNKKAQRLKAGDVVNIPADVKHWHGASSDSWFAHLAANANPEKTKTDWFEEVSNEEFILANLEKFKEE